MEERKLATIEIVHEIKLIEGADNIELATVRGWNCVVKKCEFKEGDLGIFFEVDSFLPIRPEFSFLESTGRKIMDGESGYRLRTRKLRGVVSQGLFMPIGIFHEFDHPEINISLGNDYTDLLGIKKYEVPIPLQLRGTVRRTLPSWIHRSHQDRIQNIYYDLKDTEKDTEFEVTTKIDGTNFSAYLKDGDFGVCSHNIDLKDTEESVYWRIAKKYQIENILKDLSKNLVIQSEIAGPGIQKNRCKLSELQLFVFDIWDIDKQEYWYSNDRKAFTDFYQLPHVPILRTNFKIFSEYLSIDDMLKFAEGKGINNTEREGVVCKAIGKQLSFKIINNEYLLKNEE